MASSKPCSDIAFSKPEETEDGRLHPVLGWTACYCSGSAYPIIRRVVSQGELDATGFDLDVLVFVAVFGELQELVGRNEHSIRRACGGLFETQGDEAVQVGAGESNPTIGGAFEFDVMQDRKSGSWIDHFAKPCQSWLQFRNGECRRLVAG